MTILVDLFALAVATFVGFWVRRYFILTSGEAKTNIPFIKDFNLIFGSKDIIFEHDKVLAMNSHDWHQKLGDTFGCYFGQNMQVITRDPDLIYKICVTDFQKHRNRYDFDSMSKHMRASLLEAKDQAWQTSRRAVGSVLKLSKLKIDNVDNVIDHEVGAMLASIDKRTSSMKARGEEMIFDVYQINKNFFMQSILRIVFNTDNMIDFDKDHNDVAEEMYTFVCVNYEAVCRLCFLLPIFTNLVRPFVNFFDYGKVLGKLSTKLERIIAETASSITKNRQAKNNNFHDHNSRLTTIHSLINSYKKGELSKEELMGNAIFLMLASFATSVDIMSALLFELAQNPDIQEKLRKDLLQYGEDSTYLTQCVDETLRLYPGAITNRVMGEDAYHKGMRLVRGSCFNVNIYSIHHDEKYWGQDVEEFKPERFEPEKVQKFHPAQFIPFGIGPRNCPGYHLARLEVRKFTAHFVLRYKLEVCDQTPKKLEYVALGTLPEAVPIKGPIHVRLVPISADNNSTA